MVQHLKNGKNFIKIKWLLILFGVPPPEVPYGGVREMKPLFFSGKFTYVVQISPKSDVFEFWRGGGLRGCHPHSSLA